MTSLGSVTLVALAWLLLAGAGAAQTGRHVLVVVNVNNSESVRIGEHYSRKRNVPAEQVLRLRDLPPAPPDGIDRSMFDRAVHAPLARWFARHQAHDRIHYIVLTKGIPLRINGYDNSAASVDSELSVLYLRMTGAAVPLAGPWPNPYFLGDRPVADARSFSRRDHGLYLVTRLDGFSEEDVFALIDRGTSPAPSGRFILDGKLTSPSDPGNRWLAEAAERLRAVGVPADRVVHDGSIAVLADQSEVLGYYSWGSNDRAIRRRRFGLAFAPGAIGGMFVSTDGRTFREPPKDWALGDWNDKSTWFAGSPQSLAGDLIREGITGVAGHVSEPMLGHTVRPNILFPAYVSGFNLAEAFYLAMPSLSWMTVIVGDPLCAPFAKTSRGPVEEPPIDPATELPQAFSERRLAALATPLASREALQHFVRALSRDARDDAAGKRADLERAVELAPTFLPAQHALAAHFERAGEVDRAIGAYRRIIALSSRDALALNNLAYLLATRRGELGEALELAQRAHALAPGIASITDTLGWVQFMSGNAAEGLRLIGEAASRDQASAEIRLHFAQVLAAVGRHAEARSELEKALAIDPALADRVEVKALQSR